MMAAFSSSSAFGQQAPRRTSQQDRIAQQLAEQLLHQGSSTGPVQSPLEGISRALQGVVGGYVAKQGQDRRDKREGSYNATLARALAANTGKPAESVGGIDWQAQPGSRELMTQILGGNPDTAGLGLQLQLGQQDQDRSRQQGREDYLFEQQNQAPKPPVPFSLSPGQTRFDPAGNPIASVDPKSDVLSPEAFAQNEALRRAGKPETNINNVVGGQTKGRTELDKKFASEFNDLVAGGGFADIDKGLSQLDEVVKSLESGQDLTGTLLGNMPDAVRAAINPQSMDTQELVEEVVQRNLRVILGAQFTEKEGQRLIARAYNPRLDEATNAKRVKRLMGAIKSARDAKFAAAQYFEENGTLTGFNGTTQFTFDALAAAADLPTDDRPSESGTYEVIDGKLVKIP